MRGGGELATAAARLLLLSRFPVVVIERAQPLAVRRQVAFAEAVRAGEVTVEGVRGRRVALDELAPAADHVPVAVDPEGTSLLRLSPDVIVDARMMKTPAGTTMDQARLVIGLGPGFVVGRDVHAIVETQRGPELGRVLWSGSAEADTARPAPVLGVTDARVLRAPRAGTFAARAAIGEIVARDQVVGLVDGEPVRALVGGLLRGLVADGVVVGSGIKVGDVDPRGGAVRASHISDKARAVAAGVLEAVLLGQGSVPGQMPSGNG